MRVQKLGRRPTRTRGIEEILDMTIQEGCWHPNLKNYELFVWPLSGESRSKVPASRRMCGVTKALRYIPVAFRGEFVASEALLWLSCGFLTCVLVLFARASFLSKESYARPSNEPNKSLKNRRSYWSLLLFFFLCNLERRPYGTVRYALLLSAAEKVK